jgi:hypothetical protein
MTPEAVRSSFGPKAAGAWYLHEHTASDDIQHFVMFSSIAAMIGNPGQANYSASNSYLDSLVRLRRNKGLPAVSIQWPAIADVGMAAANEEKMNQSIKEQLSLSSVKKVLQQLFTSDDLTEGEAAKSPIPWALLRKDHLPTQLLPFVSDVMMSDVGGKASKRRARAMAKRSSRVWTAEEIQSGVEAAVRKVVSIEDSQEIDHQKV